MNDWLMSSLAGSIAAGLLVHTMFRSDPRTQRLWTTGQCSAVLV